jgi:hypothetical protein
VRFGALIVWHGRHGRDARGQRSRAPRLTRRDRTTTERHLVERRPRLIGALREGVHDLYHSGIDRSKLAQWIAAHDLVATYVPATEGSRWAKASRDLPEVDEPKQLVDLVKDDEFPLSLFYVQLKPKLEDVLTREGAPA